MENVQGDERDVILISIGYGRDASGYMTMTFGPLSTAGGERRLNVLISRARWRCEVYSSISADDIDLERAKSRGAAALKIYLKFAETGRLELSQRTEREMESAFEEAVKEKIEASEHTVHTQVGMAGFFIDLAIVDPDQPGRYVLGIECDGAAYHSSRSARDRDRLRQTVLEDHGWRIHRIWSADWLHRPTETLRIVLAAIDRAIADSRTARQPLPRCSKQRRSRSTSTIGEDEAQVVVQAASPSEEYVEARFQVPQSEQIHDLSVDRLANIVKQIVSVEAPIHESEVVQRVRMLWGLGRAGSRIQAAVKSAVDFACTQGGGVCRGRSVSDLAEAHPNAAKPREHRIAVAPASRNAAAFRDPLRDPQTGRAESPGRLGGGVGSDRAMAGFSADQYATSREDREAGR
ncbi:MAG: DUF3320 domain-containing protein [Xanthomonadales bacterium]|nr:DUF3320 domain-containing protein [Xanthomonadales bacterium]